MNALRLYYLATYMGLGAVLPLLGLAMQARGFRPSQYAWLMALLPLSRVLAPPVWGALADKYVGTERLLRINTLVAAAAMILLAQNASFPLTVLAFATWAVFASALIPLAEAGTYRLLGEKPAHFGYVRVFGSIGFGVSAAGFGLWGVDPGLRWPFGFAAAAYLAASVCARGLRDGRPTTRVRLREAVGLLARRADMLLLWAASILYYAAHGVFDMYFGPHVEHIQGMSAGRVSGAWAVGVVAEVLLFLVVPRWLSGRSTGVLLVASALVSAARWYLLARADSPTQVFLLAPLHAVTFGLWYLVFVHENQADAGSDVRATVQGLAQACLGVGTCSATLIGGYFIEREGGAALFDVAACAALLAGALYVGRALLRTRGHKALAGSRDET